VSRILIGTAGWTDPTLLRKGTFYPRGTSDAAARLRVYASRFPLVEVDASYYAPPTRRHASRWAERTPDDFTFNVKAYSLLTGHPTRPGSLDADLRKTLPPELMARRHVYPGDLPQAMVDEVFHRFAAALSPLREAGKLGVVLLQFPPWFEAGHESAQQIARAARRLEGLPAAVELRHESWLSAPFRERTTAFLARLDLPFVCVDMPQGFASSLPAVPLATSKRLALVRFHGRDPVAWASKPETAAERFRYLYSRAELSEWKPRIESLSAPGADVHGVMNNCFEDHAITNAADMAAILGLEDAYRARAGGPVQLSL
jgi:uncharacterized protein YecE (DUF72 family)